MNKVQSFKSYKL